MGLFDNLFGRGSSDAKLQDSIFNLKFTAKTLARTAKKCEAEEKANKTKVKRAIEKGNIDGAKIHAQDAIRKKNEALNMLRLASRLDGVVSRLETQAKMNLVNKDMAGIVKSLEKSLNANNLEKVSETMDMFEKQFENLDVRTEFVEQAMGNTTALSTPPEEVAGLMQQIADEHGLELSTDLPAVATSAPQVKEKEDLENRLESLRGT